MLTEDAPRRVPADRPAVRGRRPAPGVPGEALRRLGQTQTDTPPTQYLRRIVYTTHISSWRRRLRDVLTESPPEHVEQRDAYAEHDDCDRLWRLVQRLAPMQRSVIVLRFYEDLSEAEIAQVLRISPGSVKVHTSRGVRRLRSMAYPADQHPTGSGVTL